MSLSLALRKDLGPILIAYFEDIDKGFSHSIIFYECLVLKETVAKDSDLVKNIKLGQHKIIRCIKFL